jgi:hypothetical protein
MADQPKDLRFAPHDRATLEYRLASKDPEEIADALYSATYHDTDWRWVQERCLTFLKSPHVGVRWVAAACLLAMHHKSLDVDLVVPALVEAADDPVWSKYSNALKDHGLL